MGGVETTTDLQKRKDWIDALRALAMLFVMFGHFYRKSAFFFIFTSPIKIPLFFVISGYLFNDKNGDIRSFMRTLFRRIVVPWICLSLALALPFVPFKGIGYLGRSLLLDLTGEQFWYLPCCILAEIIFMFSKKLTGKLWQLTAVSVMVTVVGYVLAQWEILDIFKLNTAMIVQSFLLLGHVLRQKEEGILNAKPWFVIACCAGYIVLVAVSMQIYPGRGLDVNNNSYYSIPLCAALIGAGSLALFMLAPKIKWYPKALTYVGRNTLVFYYFHLLGRSVVVKGLELFGITLPDTWYVAIVMTVVVCIGCGIGAAVINYVLPEMVGRERIKRAKV